MQEKPVVVINGSGEWADFMASFLDMEYEKINKSSVENSMKGLVFYIL